MLNGVPLQHLLRPPVPVSERLTFRAKDCPPGSDFHESRHSHLQEVSIIMYRFLLSSLVFSLSVSSLAAQSDGVTLHTLNNPDGGHVTFGVFEQASTMQAAMTGMLRKMHEGFGNKPEVGQFFRSRDGQSVATFFTVNQSAANSKPVAGMVIVTMPTGMKPAAAALYDQAARFSTTKQQLMKRLTEAMSAGAMNQGGAQGVSAGTHHGNGPAPVPSLRPVYAPDNSAMMKIAPGWQLRGGSSGQMIVDGPHGETLEMTIVHSNIYDPNNAQSRNMMQYVSRSGGAYSMCSPSRDLLVMYQCVSNQQMRRLHRPQVSFVKVLENKSLGASPNLPVNSHVLADIDLGDGRGAQRASIDLGAAAVGGGIYTLYVTQLNVPEGFVEEQWPTVMAMSKTYQQNEAVIRNQTSQALAQQNQWFDAQQSAHRAQVAQGDAQTRSFEAHNDAMDRQSKSFQNYQLDHSIVQDGQQNTRGTLSNNTAQAYVTADPQRYQIIEQKDWIKGVDY